jgi:coproporphyrinogen III oxidase
MNLLDWFNQDFDRPNHSMATSMMKHIIIVCWSAIFVASSVRCYGLQAPIPRGSRSCTARSVVGRAVPQSTTGIASGSITSKDDVSGSDSSNLFDEFASFLKATQESIIHEIESTIEKDSGAQFSNDSWGQILEDNDDESTRTADRTMTGGITRVLQGGDAVEKGACSLTIIRNGVLTAERAATIRGRQQAADSSTTIIQAGDTYSAAALSMVLHSRNPLVPTFRSDVRIFQVLGQGGKDDSLTWFGGGADLTPYYLFTEDIQMFHHQYHALCSQYDDFDYHELKQACDDYFYLPARSEHRGTGGIFFDDVVANDTSRAFVQNVAKTWMPSWLPIVQRRNGMEYTAEQKYWQKLRRGRYLEFNLLYDVRSHYRRCHRSSYIIIIHHHHCHSRKEYTILPVPLCVYTQRGVKFGLQTANPRVEGVMVSAPPEIAYAYNHIVAPDSPEGKLLAILQQPIIWVS